jgi:F0F1-type ATP synthase membrane subunit b/b'
MTEIVISFIFNVLLGIIMFFMKQNNDALRDRIKKVEEDVDRIKDTTVKKEDFREFKEELWLRLDRMELHFEKRLGGSK